jgi:ATP-dependent DNA ligase
MKAKKSVDFNVPNTNDPSKRLLELIQDEQFAMDLKCDGTRAVFEFDEDGVPTIYGRGTVQVERHSKDRKQRVYNEQFPEMSIKMPELALTTLDTEIVITDPDTGIENYNILQTRANRKSDIGLYAQKYPALGQVFDIQRYNGEDLTGKTLRERLEVLETIFEVQRRLGRLQRLPVGMNPTAKTLIAQKALQTGAEGVMVKDLDATYKDGRGNWFKAKRTHTEDVFILGVEPGRGKFAPYFGQLHTYQFDDRGNIHYVCAVGGGFTFEEMAEIKQFFGACFQRPHNNQTDLKSRYHSLKNGGKLMVIEIKHYGIQKTGRRHPVFLRIRQDKDGDECISRDSAGNEQAGLEEFF